MQSSSLGFFKETKCIKQQIEDYRRRLGFKFGFTVDREGLSGGLAMLWDDSLSLKISSYSWFRIDCVMTDYDNNVWRLTGFHGNPEAS